MTRNRSLFCALALVAACAFVPCALTLAHADTTGEVTDLGSLWNLPAPGAGVNLFATNLQLRAAGRGVAVLRIQASLAIAGKLDLVESDGTTTIVGAVLDGATLGASHPNGFVYEARKTTPAGKALSYNFRLETDGIVNHLRVTECDGTGN